MAGLLVLEDALCGGADLCSKLKKRWGQMKMAAMHIAWPPFLGESWDG
jgi:hypothetical protein